MARIEQRHHLDHSTLAELRDIVTATADLPADMVVRAQTRFTMSPDGGLLSRLHIGAPREDGTIR